MMEKFSFKEFFMKTLNGMAYGLFATLIIGVIFQQLGGLLGIELIEVTLFQTLRNLMGVGIGLGIALSLKLDGLKLVVATVMGGISTSLKTTFGFEIIAGLNNNPVTTYLVVILGIYLMSKILVKRTPVDVLLVPLLGSLIALGLTLVLSAPVDFIINQIAYGVDQATILQPFIMSIVIAVVMGMLLTSPLSSAAIAIAIQLSGIAAGAAVIGTTTQMIGFAIQSRKDNNIGIVLSIAFGTSMLQFKNIIKKPVIWLPTIITSAILGPIFVLVYKAISTPYGAGMGSSGLVGQLQTLFAMDYSALSWIIVASQLIFPVILVFAIDLIFRTKGLIETGDLKIGQDIG